MNNDLRDLPKEYRPIPSAPRYSVDPTGEIIGPRGTPRRPSLSRGYKAIVIRLFGGGNRILYPHRAVAEAFIPNPDHLPCVNHLNGIKTDNRVENLEWCTYSGNLLHAHAIGLRKNAIGEESLTSKLTEEGVRSIRSDAAKGESYTSLAAKHGVSATTIKKVVIGEKWNHIK